MTPKIPYFFGVTVIHYKRLDYQLCYWRTNNGAELDLLICRGSRLLAGIEIKSARNITREGLQGTRSFLTDHPDVPVFVLGNNQNARRLLAENITLMNWDDFVRTELDRLG